MIATTDRHTQFGRALANANIKGDRVSGVYILWPGWSRVPFVKIGMTKSIYARLYSSYHHSMPDDHPGNSFDIVGFMVCHPELARKREARAHELTNNLSGWSAPEFDKEWRHWNGPLSKVYEAIANLLISIRTQVDGIWYTFERGTGKIVRRGGWHASLDQASVIPLAPNVLTRTMSRRGTRKIGSVQIIDGSVVGVDGSTRHLRDSKKPEELYELQ